MVRSRCVFGSFPSADRLLSEIVDKDYEGVDVIGLSFHVTYWDYIGWKDPYADRKFSQRQRTYAQKLRTYQPLYRSKWPLKHLKLLKPRYNTG